MRQPAVRSLGLLFALLFGGAMTPAVADAYDAGDYVIHYNALPTDQLAPDVASAYGIVRSKTRAMLNIAIIRKQAGTTGTPVTGQVNVHTANLTGQVKDLRLRRIDEGEAIYYIGEVTVADGETLIFDLYVTPEGEEKTHHIRFQHSFFAS